ncbi:MAG: histidine kinase [Pyrinomonadaceae bacterium]|nr:histidine kinase [Pyrinomonadaceae bacterium]
MTDLNIAVLINLLGWAIGLALYAMLLTMSVRTLRLASSLSNADPVAKDRQAIAGSASKNGFDLLPLATALLGLLWNAGAFVTQGLHGLGVSEPSTPAYFLLGASSFAALGFLPAVVVHSALQNLNQTTHERLRRVLTLVAYGLSTLAAGMHFYRAFTDQQAASETGLQLLTGGFVLLIVGLFLLTRREPGWPRAVWATALAVFAVSALHLSTGDNTGNHEQWYVELIGHHASLPLVSAILYQDYRFAFADIFLKRALALLAYVALVVGAFGFYVWIFPTVFTTSDFSVVGANSNAGAAINSRSVGVLLALWMGTGLLYVWLQRAARWFVDSIVLRRVDYTALRLEIARVAQKHEASDELLDDVCMRLQPALTAREVSWRTIESIANVEAADMLSNGSHVENDLDSFVPPLQNAGVHARRRGSRQRTVFTVPTAELPRYELKIGELAGGRRLLSDDFEMLEAVALTIARRIDAMRVTHERCEQVQREQEIAKLATEAQLRALRAQVNPHFLFNSLTTIGYLIQTSPERALETLLRLTDLLRRVLRSTAEWVTLGEELKLTESYLDIERARFEERLRVAIDVPPQLHALQVPSLVVQPLVENAIKHGIAPLRAGGELSILARLVETPDSESKELRITVRDTGAGASAAKLAEGRKHGVGLANVEQRLRLCCGATARLHIESAPGAGAIVRIHLPLRSAVTSAHPHRASDNQVGAVGETSTALAETRMDERKAG